MVELPFKVFPKKAIVGDKLMIIYNDGLLIDGLNKDIYLVFGFGRDKIEKVFESKMIKKNSEYIMTIPIISEGILFISFRDSYGNVDDNNKNYYKLHIQKEE